MQAVSDLFDPAVIDDPYPMYAALRRTAPVCRITGTASSWRRRPTRCRRPPPASRISRRTSPRCWSSRATESRSSTWTVAVRRGTCWPPPTIRTTQPNASWCCPAWLRLDRANLRGHLAFDKGLHFFVGAALARTEARIALRTLLEHTESFSLTGAERLPSILVRRHRRLELSFT